MAVTDPIQIQINQVVARLAAIDGIGLPSSMPAALAQLGSKIAGLKKTLGNVNLGYQTELNALSAEFHAFQSLVLTALNLPPQH